MSCHEAVPLHFEGVVIGFVGVQDRNRITLEIVSPDTQTYLREILTTQSVEGVTMTIDFSQEVDTHSFTHGHLRLVEGQDT